MPRRCLTCCRGLPEWDTHTQCSQHWECSKSHPCAACSLWTAPTWALSEAWLKAHPPFQRAPSLVPSAAPADQDLPTDTSVTPAPPEETSPASAGTAIDVHASGDSDWETGEEPSRAWCPVGAKSGSLSVSIPRYNGPAHTSGLSQITGAGEPSSSLPQPQTTISRTSAVGWYMPPGNGGEGGKRQADGLAVHQLY